MQSENFTLAASFRLVALVLDVDRLVSLWLFRTAGRSHIRVALARVSELVLCELLLELIEGRLIVVHAGVRLLFWQGGGLTRSATERGQLRRRVLILFLDGGLGSSTGASLFELSGNSVHLRLHEFERRLLVVERDQFCAQLVLIVLYQHLICLSVVLLSLRLQEHGLILSPECLNLL